MNMKLNQKKNKIEDYAVVYIEAPNHPEIERFVYVNRKTIYINLSAKKGAKIIRLVQ